MGGGISRCHLAEKQRRRQQEKEDDLRAKIMALEEQITELKSAARDDDHEEEVEEDDDEAARWPSSPKMEYPTEEEERLRWLAAAAASSSSSERMQRRNEMGEQEEAVEKWKQLYLAIKAELDLLIHRTQRVEKIEAALGLMRKGQRFDWKAEELMMEWHAKELKSQEEMMETLRSRIAAMEKEEAKKDREMDILRQSLKILGAKVIKEKKRSNLLSPAAACSLCSASAPEYFYD